MSAARTYIETWASGDRAALAELVTDDIDFAGPMTRVTGREAFLDAVGSFAAQVSAVEILHVAGDDADAVILYAMDTGAGRIPAAEHLRFADGKVGWSRLIFDSWALRRG